MKVASSSYSTQQKAISSCAVQQNRQVLRFLTGLQVIDAVELSLFKLEPFAIFRQLPSPAPCVHPQVLLTVVLYPLGPRGGEQQPDRKARAHRLLRGWREPVHLGGDGQEELAALSNLQAWCCPFPSGPSLCPLRGLQPSWKGGGKAPGQGTFCLLQVLPQRSSPVVFAGCSTESGELPGDLAERRAGCKEKLIFSKLQGTAAGGARPASVALPVPSAGAGQLRGSSGRRKRGTGASTALAEQSWEDHPSRWQLFPHAL